MLIRSTNMLNGIAIPFLLGKLRFVYMYHFNSGKNLIQKMRKTEVQK